MNTLKAEKRSMEIKAKRLRREGYVVGNVFGHKIEGSLPIRMVKKDVEKLLRNEGKGGQVVLDVDGTQYNALIKDIDYNSMKREITTIDFQALVSDEMVHSVAEIVFENRDLVKTGVVQELLTEISYRAYPSDLVESVKVDVSQLHIGDQIFVRDLDIAKNPGIKLQTNPDAPVVALIEVHAAPEEEAVETAEK